MEIKRSDLIKALEVVKPGLSNKEVIEQSTSFAFMKNKIVTYNDEISMSHPVENLNLKGAVKADELYMLLTKIKKEEIEMELTEKEIIISSGKMKAGMALQKEIKLPLDEIGEMGDWKKLPDDFLKLLGFVSSVCTRDMSNPLLTCVHVREEGVLEATDRYRIIQAKSAKKMPIGNVLIPAQSVPHIVKLKPTLIASGVGWVHFKTEKGTTLSCRIFTDAYPKVDAHMKVEGETVTFPKSINDLLDRAAVFTAGQDFLNEQIACTVNKNRVLLKSESETGWFEEEANMAYTGTPIAFLITPGLFKDILKETQTGVISKERIVFEGENWKYLGMLRVVPKKA